MTLATYLDKKGNTAVALAARLGVTHPSVLRWAAGRVPAERVRAVSAETGIPLHELRPDLFDAPAASARAACDPVHAAQPAAPIAPLSRETLPRTER